VPQSVTVVTQELIKNQMMMSIAMSCLRARITHIKARKPRSDVVRGNSSSADFFVDAYVTMCSTTRPVHVDRVEALKGPNA